MDRKYELVAPSEHIDQLVKLDYRFAIHISIDLYTISSICVKTGAHYVIKEQLISI